MHSKYEYGVEYETNGEKPDLDGDITIIVEAKYDSGGKMKARYANWKNIVSFMVVDERYKPKPEESTWHERGELPPVGEIVEFNRGDGYGFCNIVEEYWKDGDKLEIIAHRKGQAALVAVVWNMRDQFSTCLISKHMRPIRTERGALVEKAIKIAGDANAECDITFAGALIDANWRPIKPMKEAELFEQMFDIFQDYAAGKQGYSAKRGIKALIDKGCRFIDTD